MLKRYFFIYLFSYNYFHVLNLIISEVICTHGDIYGCRVSSTDEEAQNAFVEKWVQAHIQDSNDVLGKPILLSEFGKSSRSSGYSVEKRDSYFQKLYDAIYNSASTGGSCAGGLFWQLMTQGMDGLEDGYEVIFEESPSTTNVITQQSKRMSSLK